MGPDDNDNGPESDAASGATDADPAPADGRITRRRVIGVSAGVAVAAAVGIPLGLSFRHRYAAANTHSSTTGADELVGRYRPGDAFALKGCVVGGHEVLDPGYVTIDPTGKVASVSGRAPSGVFVLDTAGVILPGLIDLHNHPEWNVFAPWEPPQLFGNRYEWRASPIYEQIVAGPEAQLMAALPLQTQLRYSEIRSLVGGVTAIQGANPQDAETTTSLIRTVDQQIFGERVGRSMVDLPLSASDPLTAELNGILADVHAGRAKAFYVHLAEGARDDAETLAEYDHLVALGGVTHATVVIHGAGLARAQLGDLRDAGAKLVWSPQSNLRLYGQTTRAGDALDVGLPLGIGPDWLPSGSTSLLAELRTARQVLAEQGHPLSAEQLVRIVTSGAADMAGLPDRLGTLAAGRAADVVVLARLSHDPFESVLLSDRADVHAVFVAGSLAYGHQSWARALGADSDAATGQTVYAWGRQMLLDTGTETASDGTTRPAPTLDQLRAQLIAEHPQIGPIFA